MKQNYKLAYHTVREWEKAKVNGLTRPIDKDDFMEDLPGCIAHFRKLWMESLEEQHDKDRRIEAQYDPTGWFA